MYYGTSSDYLSDKVSFSDSFSVSAGEGQYIYIIVSKISEFTVMGLTGGFENIGQIQISGLTYYIYKSINSNLGQTDITRSDI